MNDRLPMRRAMFALMRYHLPMFPVIVLIYILQYTVHMVPALAVRGILDSLSGQQAAGLNFWSLIAIWVGAQCAGTLLFIADVSIETHYYHRFWALLRTNIFERILQRPGARPLPGSSGEAVNVLRDDVSQVQQVMSMMYNIFATTVFALIAFAIMFSINARLTLFVFLPLALVTVVMNRARSRIVKLREGSRDAASRVSGALGEIFNGVGVIKAAGAEDRVVGHLHRLNRKRREAGVREEFFSEGIVVVLRNVTQLGTAMILFLGGSAISDGTFTVGDLTLYIFFLGWISIFTTITGLTIANWRQGAVSMNRMYDLMQGAPPEQLVHHRPVYVNEPAPLPPAQAKAAGDALETLDVSGLTLAYPNGRGIHDISFSLRRGEIVAITGKIGSGKTTLLRALLGLLPFEDGEIRWNGRRVDTPAEFFVPPRAAYTPQIPRLFSDTLRDNLTMGLPADTDLIPAVHAAVLEDDLAAMPDGLQTMVGARGMRLSGGQIQRMAAARMFARDPELIVVDDLSSALDLDTEQTLWERFFAHTGRTCIVVTHRPHVLARADKVIRLDDGRAF